MNSKKLVVIGGGAAGFFCAVNAARMNPLLKVFIAEKGGSVLQKVKVSGGGRCNVTHACFDIDEMAKCYPRGERFMKKAFHQFFTTDTIDWFEKRGVSLKTEEDGRMFPHSNSSQTIIDCLMKEMNRYKVELQLYHSVEKIQPIINGFNVSFKNGEIVQADFVVIACGGFQKIIQFDWLNNLSLKIEKPVPSLFTFNFPKHPLNNLMGIAAPNSSIKIVGIKFLSEGPILITHWGLSGPAVLRLSAFAARDLEKLNYKFSVIINWCTEFNEQSFVKQIHEQRKLFPAKKPSNGNFSGVASRLWEFILLQSGVSDSNKWSDLTNATINKLAKNCCAFEMFAEGKTAFKEEFVSAGGISLSEVDANTMMSKKYPGLYFGGEILDVDGITGGYNFQNAWTSGFVAAKSIVKYFV